MLWNFKTGFICTTTTLAFGKRADDHRLLLMKRNEVSKAQIINWWNVRQVPQTMNLEDLKAHSANEERRGKNLWPAKATKSRAPLYLWRCFLKHVSCESATLFRFFHGFDSDGCHLIQNVCVWTWYTIVNVSNPKSTWFWPTTIGAGEKAHRKYHKAKLLMGNPS